MKDVLAAITELVCRETGITMGAERQGALRAALRRAAPGLEPAAILRAASDPVYGRRLMDRLIDEVTIKETAFVRDHAQLDAIPWHALLQTAAKAGSHCVRVWSAACATGEEPYTLALLAGEAFATARVPVDVLGTDISSAALAAAAMGRYRERAVRALEPRLRDRYLDRQADGSYAVGERLRGLVRFRRHNLVKDPIPPAGETGFDLVVCRNVLIYFGQPLAGLVVESLERSLRPGGMLMLGAVDALQRAKAVAAMPATGPPGLSVPGSRPSRRPLGRQHVRSREERLAAALDAADAGDRDDALAQVASLITDDPLDADAHFLQGLVTLAAGDPALAAAALRRALYADSAFALAAFTLGRAYDAIGDAVAARRAYERALLTIDSQDHHHDLILQQVNVGDIAAACRARLGRTKELQT